MFIANPADNIRSRENLVPLKTEPVLVPCFACAARS